ncbi:MAG: hypothetical protein RQ847_01395 [Wenzhouxiangellaceae bacterium]|nr:hypothetical protein [Wenzhouxiangellaceae bacterium]
MLRVIRHFAQLSSAMTALWLLLVWYVVMVWLHFESSPRLWLNSLAMSVVVGTALVLSVRHGGGPAREFWRLFRLYAIPFCVSSFSALVRDDRFYAIFAPSFLENLAAAGGCTVFAAWLLLARLLERAYRPAAD